MKYLRPVTLFVVLLVMLACMAGCQAEHTITGAWKDTAGEYVVSFGQDGTYIDSAFGLSLEYSLKGDELIYYTPAGDMCCARISWSPLGKLRITIGGSYRELEPCTDVSTCVFPDTAYVSSEVGSGDHYTLRSALPLVSDLYLTENGIFALSVTDGSESGTDWHSADFEGLRGIAAKSCDGRHVVLYYNGGEAVDVLPLSEDGSYMGALPLTNDGELLVQQDYHNPALGVESGYILDGVVFDTSNSTSYVFSPDSLCTKRTQGGDEVRYTYYIDPQGLITLGSVEGGIKEDYLFYDALENRVYRLVYRRDSWYDFVSSIITTSLQSSGEDDHATTVAALDFREHLAVPFVEGCNPQYENVGDIDYEYTSASAATLRELQAQIEADDALRKEYEASRLEEQRRFLLREQERAREHARVKAAMDARVEAEIASGGLGSSSNTDDWLDEFISQLEQLDGYDQGSAYDSPGVDNGDAEFPVSTSPQPPVIATPTEPQDPSVEESEPPVSQYNPEFHIDFVCTCVNCHVSSLPVELNADNVLLVDATVIAPGTPVNVEGYGMVTARASGGSISGQTAVCYSNDHNAVNRYSSGTYNVYQVVG